MGLMIPDGIDIGKQRCQLPWELLASAWTGSSKNEAYVWMGFSPGAYVGGKVVTPGEETATTDAVGAGADCWLAFCVEDAGVWL